MNLNQKPFCTVRLCIKHGQSLLSLSVSGCHLSVNSLSLPSLSILLKGDYFDWPMNQTSYAVSQEINYFIVALIQATNLITKKELLTMDPDTEDKQLIYEITAGPKHGYVESKLRPGVAVTTFTQGKGVGIRTACHCPLPYCHPCPFPLSKWVTQRD